MPGIYVHIPFCRRKCHYCDFYSLALLSKEQDFVDALCREIAQASPDKETAETIYFGGGTPSLLSDKSLERIMLSIRQNFEITKGAEISLEANPEDIRPESLKIWKELGFNRLSIGIQSTDDRILSFLGRKHSSRESLKSLEEAQKSGFENVSADLIYGIPGLNHSIWEKCIKTILSTGIQHLSAYHLTIEPGTLLNRRLKQNHFALPADEESYHQFMLLFDITEKEGFPWYEISNFAKKDFHSRHNAAYWDDTAYYGFGPSAHSYDGENIRSWNLSDLNDYIAKGGINAEQEYLDGKDKFNDYLITRLRTRRGLEFGEMEKRFGSTKLSALKRKLRVYTDTGKAKIEGDCFRLKPESLFISDSILKDIIYI
ncbi:MAG: radical SAM family heme chaperone HemW [Bacteroidales bacterium]